MPSSHEVTQSVNNVLTTLIETRAVEYKQSETFGVLEPHIVKTAMAMSNLRGGGFIIVGVGPSGTDGLTRTGISSDHLATYDSDDLLAKINRFSSPAVSAMVATVEHNNIEYLVIAVQEFERTPVICRRDGQWPDKQRVFAGTIFIRPTGLVETRTPQTAAELDEVIDLAAEKRAIYLIRMRETLNATGGASVPAAPTAAEQYIAELGKAAEL